jgi:hypothetical protein
MNSESRAKAQKESLIVCTNEQITWPNPATIPIMEVCDDS